MPPSKRQLTCGICAAAPGGEKYVFTSRATLKAHKASKHAGMKETCPECGKECNDASNLRRHRKIHRPDSNKVWQCRVCNETLGYRRDNAMRHIKTQCTATKDDIVQAAGAASNTTSTTTMSATASATTSTTTSTTDTSYVVSDSDSNNASVSFNMTALTSKMNQIQPIESDITNFDENVDPFAVDFDVDISNSNENFDTGVADFDMNTTSSSEVFNPPAATADINFGVTLPRVEQQVPYEYYNPAPGSMGYQYPNLVPSGGNGPYLPQMGSQFSPYQDAPLYQTELGLGNALNQMHSEPPMLPMQQLQWEQPQQLQYQQEQVPEYVDPALLNQGGQVVGMSQGFGAQSDPCLPQLSYDLIWDNTLWGEVS